jgi:hypothetical protein
VEVWKLLKVAGAGVLDEVGGPYGVAVGVEEWVMDTLLSRAEDCVEITSEVGGP